MNYGFQEIMEQGFLRDSVYKVNTILNMFKNIDPLCWPNLALISFHTVILSMI